MSNLNKLITRINFYIESFQAHSYEGNTKRNSLKGNLDHSVDNFFVYIFCTLIRSKIPKIVVNFARVK